MISCRTRILGNSCSIYIILIIPRYTDGNETIDDSMDRINQII